MRAGWIAAAAVMAAVAPAALAQPGGMRAFASDTELTDFLKRRLARQRSTAVPPPPAPPPVVAVPPLAAPAVTMDAPAAGQDVVVTAARADTPGITNTQEAAVDEGGIVKQRGRHLVVLRRGRLFTIDIGGGAMRLVDRIDAFPPGTTGADAWYDEMLVAGDQAVVIGYRYGADGSEINRFRIADDGRLTFLDSHMLRSNDYYSSSNYASRLIGTTLIFYTPLDLDLYRPILGQLPALRRRTGSGMGAYRRILSANRLYVPAPVRRDADADVTTLHTVTTCDLAAPQFTCRATGVLGSSSREFYVSGTAVHVWIGEALGRGRRSRSLVYRLPLDGTRPGAVQATGAPVDQFSFREDATRGVLDVLVRDEGDGGAMWRSETNGGAPALLRLPLAAFGDGAGVASRTAYRPLPLDRGDDWSFHNRYVGRWLLYSAGSFAEATGETGLFAVPLDGGGVVRIAVPHGIDRIDVMGGDAVAIGNDARDRLGFSAIELTGTRARIGDSSFLPAAREGERRSQAFFYRPDPDSRNGASGILGLPITRDLGDSPLARFVGAGSAIAFLRRDARRFTPAGTLDAQAERARDDGCQASCVDWYGNARPIFTGGRVFALMGYELVEGRLQDGRVREVARTDFAPPAAPPAR